MTASAGNTLTKSIVTPTKWDSVAVWQYDSKYDTCPLCRESISNACLDCQSQVDGNVVTCSRVWSTFCDHCYHSHCLQRWHRPTCPVCEKPWRAERVL